MTYSDKKVDHKKYIKGEVDLLRHVARPLLALFDTLTVVPPQKKKKNKNNVIQEFKLSKRFDRNTTYHTNKSNPK